MDNQKLLLTIVKAEDLKAADRNGLSDPYVELFTKSSSSSFEKEVGKTKKVKKTLNPEFGETFELPLTGEIIIIVKDWNLITKHVVIGTASFYHDEDAHINKQDTPVVLNLEPQGKLHVIVHPMAIVDSSKPGRDYRNFTFEGDKKKDFNIMLPYSLSVEKDDCAVIDGTVHSLSFSELSKGENHNFIIKKIPNYLNQNISEALRNHSNILVRQLEKVTTEKEMDKEVIHDGLITEKCYGKFKHAALVNIRYTKVINGKEVVIEHYSFAGSTTTENAPFFECYTWHINSLKGAMVDERRKTILRRIAGYSELKIVE